MPTTFEDNIPTDCNRPGAGKMYVPVASLAKLYRAGMPPDQPLRRYIVMAGIDFGPKYNAFAIEFFGTEGIWPTSSGNETKQKIADKWTIHTAKKQRPEGIPNEILRYKYTDGAERVINLWRQRVFLMEAEQKEPYIEKVWFVSVSKWITSIENIHNDAEPRTSIFIKRLADGLPLLSLSFKDRLISGYTSEDIEVMISETVEKMAQAELDKSRPQRFKVKRFAAYWPVSTSRTNIYNYVSRERLAANGEIEKKYNERCKDLAEEN